MIFLLETSSFGRFVAGDSSSPFSKSSTPSTASTDSERSSQKSVERKESFYRTQVLMNNSFSCRRKTIEFRCTIWYGVIESTPYWRSKRSSETYPQQLVSIYYVLFFFGLKKIPLLQALIARVRQEFEHAKVAPVSPEEAAGKSPAFKHKIALGRTPSTQ